VSSFVAPSLWEIPAAPAEAAAPAAPPVADGEFHRLAMRPYQQAFVAAVIAEFRANRLVLAVSATGTGKTVSFAHLIDRMPADRRVLVLAHRDELIRQAAAKVHEITGERPAIEMGDEWADQGRGVRRVIVSSVQTQIAVSRHLGRQARMTRFDPTQFCLLIIDEAHRAVSPSYRQVIAYYTGGNPDLCVLGVTATPDRGDAQALGNVFQSVAFRFPIFDAISQGWLVGVRQTTVKVVCLDLSKVGTTAGDLNGKDLAQVLEFERTLHEMAAPVLELARGRQTLVFCASVAHAERFSEILNRHRPGCSRWVCGDQAKVSKEDRRRLFDGYARREFQVLCNVGVATEGTDLPGVEVVVMARPTKSRALYEQMLGRGTRPHESVASLLGRAADDAARLAMIAASPKPYMEVIDFAGNAGKHKLITPADVLGGNYSEAARAKAKKKASAKKGVPADVMELLRLSDAELAAATTAKQAKEKADADRRQRIVADATYRTKEIDPFDLYAVKPPEVRRWHGLPPATDAQVRALEKYGIDASETSRGEAGRLMGELRGRVTAKQASVLKRAGYDQAEIKELKADEASRLIDRVKLNGWRRPGAADIAAKAAALVGATEGAL
jgi:superfamily II DNA or RNA helicase